MTHLEIYNDLKNHEVLFHQYRMDNTVRFANPAHLVQFNHYAMVLNLGVENLGCRECVMTLLTKLSKWYFTMKEEQERVVKVVTVAPEEVKPVQQQLFTKKKRRRRWET